MNRFYILAIPLCMILFSGCIQVNLPKMRHNTTKTFELTPPAAPAAFQYPVEVVAFLSDSPAKFKMLYRSGNSLRNDEYGKWAQTPSLMLTRFFRTVFSNASGKNMLVLRGKILTFEADEISKKVNLAVSYSISKEGESEALLNFVLRDSVPMKSVSADEYANAMKLALSRQADEVKAKILKQFPAGK